MVEVGRVGSLEFPDLVEQLTDIKLHAEEKTQVIAGIQSLRFASGGRGHSADAQASEIRAAEVIELEIRTETDDEGGGRYLEHAFESQPHHARTVVLEDLVPGGVQCAGVSDIDEALQVGKASPDHVEIIDEIVSAVAFLRQCVVTDAEANAAVPVEPVGLDRGHVGCI